jgi:serine/threonine-protein kinase
MATMADTKRAERRKAGKTWQARRGEQDMSARTMLVLGGIMTVGVVAVLGMTTMVRGGGASSEAPARPAAVSRQDGAPVETVPAASRPVRQVAITPHVAVPPTQGLALETAKVRLRATRLVMAGALHVPSSLPAGEVVRSDPVAGTGLTVGGGVTLYVSTGVPAVAQVTVPYLRGLTLAQARIAAARLELRVVVTGGRGSVTVQTPPPGSVTPRGSEIAVVLHG